MNIPPVTNPPGGGVPKINPSRSSTGAQSMTEKDRPMTRRFKFNSAVASAAAIGAASAWLVAQQFPHGIAPAPKAFAATTIGLAVVPADVDAETSYPRRHWLNPLLWRPTHQSQHPRRFHQEGRFAMVTARKLPRYLDRTLCRLLTHSHRRRRSPPTRRAPQPYPRSRPLLQLTEPTAPATLPTVAATNPATLPAVASTSPTTLPSVASTNPATLPVVATTSPAAPTTVASSQPAVWPATSPAATQYAADLPASTQPVTRPGSDDPKW